MKTTLYKMDGLSCAAWMCLSLVNVTQAATVNVTFDEPDYLAGQLPPAPWSQEYEDTGYSVGAGVGNGNTQGLVVSTTQWAGITYDSPTVLTSAAGASSITIQLKPGGGQSAQTNFMSFGGMQIGNGSKRLDTGYQLGMVFRKVSGGNGIYGPGGGVWGTYMGAFTVDQWYEMTFELNAECDTVTLSAGPVGGTQTSMTYPWNGGDISRVWVLGTNEGSAPVYDNLTLIPGLVPEPSSVGLLALSALAVFRRRRSR